MGFDLEKANETLRHFDRLVEEGRVESWSGELKVGVDLGTANTLIMNNGKVVVDENFMLLYDAEFAPSSTYEIVIKTE